MKSLYLAVNNVKENIDKARIIVTSNPDSNQIVDLCEFSISETGFAFIAEMLFEAHPNTRLIVTGVESELLSLGEVLEIKYDQILAENA